MKYLDTTIPLCVMTGSPGKYYKRCIEIMKGVEGGDERVVTSVFTIAEMGHILESRENLGKKKVMDMLVSLLDCIGLKLLDVEALLCMDAITLKARYKIDFVDAYNVLTMRRNGIKEIISLDTHYDMFKDIKRTV